MATSIRRVVNRAPTPDFDASSVSSAEAKIEFARRLSNALAEAGLTQSDLARRATDHLPAGKKLGRDSISHYVNGLSFPSDARIRALAKALNIPAEELLPGKGIKTAADHSVTLAAQETENGKMYLRINRTVDYETGLKILALIKKDEAKQP